MKSKVALIKGDSRAGNIEEGLRLLEGEINIDDKKDILIKVNFVSTHNQLAATHVDSVRALFRFLRQRFGGKITIGESTGVSAHEGYTRFGYRDLVREFDVELLDLNEGEWVSLQVYDSALRPMRVRFSKRVAESDYRIAVGPAKTHDSVIVTLSIKNLVMGSLYRPIGVGVGSATRRLLREGYRFLPSFLRRVAKASGLSSTAGNYVGGDKHRIHQGYPAQNLNLYLMAEAYRPDLSIIDGYTGMDGDGPLDGDPVPWGVAIVSRDPVAADCLAASLMGFSISEIGYLWYCHKKSLGVGDIGQMDIRGADPQDCYRRFQPPPGYEEQKEWRDDKISKLLRL